MKKLEISYKIILSIIFIIIFAIITGNKSLAITQPRYAPDGGSWDGWFCAQSGYSYWNKYSYYGNLDAYDYQLKGTITHSTGYGSTDNEKKYWHMLGYVLYYAQDHDASFVVNHYYRSSTGHKIAGTVYDRAVQDAVWQILRGCNAIRTELGTGKPASSCGCGNNLIAEAEKSWNKGNPTENYEFTIQVWKDNLGYKVSRGYLRQPLIKTSATIGDPPKKIKLKFYKKDFAGEGLDGAQIKVTTTEGTIEGNLTESEAQKGYFGTLKITPNAESNDGSIEIKISEIKTPAGYKAISDISLTINYNKNTGKVTSITEPANTDTDKNSNGVGIINIINKADVPVVKVHFYKWNAKLNKRLMGAEIDVEKGENVSEITKKLYTSSKKGYLGYVNVIPDSSNPGEFTITVKETTAPANYNKIAETNLTITYDTETGEIKGVVSEDENCAYGIENDNGVIIIRILNHARILRNMTILKTDFENNPIANVKFDVYLNNISYIKVGETLYFVEEEEYNEMVSQNEEEGYTSDEIVLLNVDEEKSITYNVDGNETQAKIKRLANGSDTNRLRIYDISTNSKGEIVFPEMMISKGYKTRKVYVTIYETETPEGYQKVPNDLRLVLKYDETIKGWKLFERNSEIETDSQYWNSLDTKYWDLVSNNAAKVQIYNKVKIESITLEKKDPVNEYANMSGAKFNISLSNISKIDGQEYNGTLEKTVDSNGKIVLKNLEVTDSSKNVEITVKKTAAPPATDEYYYKPISEEVKITLTRNSGAYSISVPNNEIAGYKIVPSGTVDGSKVSFIANNVPYIKINGKVWVDGQEGTDKAPENLNGKYDQGETTLKNIKVYLCDASGKAITGITNPIKTNDNGEYEFKDIVKTKNGYKVYFEYNGILYYADSVSKDTNASEFNRSEFNTNFQTITQGKANGGATLNYNYNDEKSKLLIADGINIDEQKNGATYPEQAIKAATETVVNNATLNCGLVKKHFDLRIDNLIDKVEYKINGKTWEDDSNKNVDNVKINSSDYKYRFNTYEQNNIQKFTTKYLDDDTAATKEDLIRKDKVGEASELKIYAYYNLVLSNQSIHDVQNAKIKYRWNNEVYKLESVEGASYTSINDNDNEIEIDVSNPGVESKTIVLKFELRDNADELPTKIEEAGGLDAITSAEITSYTTKEGGLVDNDSEPGNGKIEDDLSDTKLNFSLKTEAREISGNVAEAKIEDGKATEELGNTRINDVIVQLIEVIKIDDRYYEYIWQETQTGSNTVKARTKDNQVYTYEVDLGDQQYKFLGHSQTAKDSLGNNKSLDTGFIPGDYIVRFIYGDGTTYDLTDNVTKYNGQDYKSTIDKSYFQPNYSIDNYGTNKSTARDNEARRLEVMAFSTVIDEKIGTALDTLNKDYDELNSDEKDVLKTYYNELYDNSKTALEWAYRGYDTTKTLPGKIADDASINEDRFEIIRSYVSWKTWMCAETSTINVIDDEEDDKFTEINFALMERPNTELVVEKHITALKITPTGVGVQAIVDAKADIDQILDVIDNPNTSIENTGVTSGLASILSTRTNRGFWKVETDIEELAQGAKLEVEYTYVIRNKGQEDYLSDDVINEYIGNIGKDANSDGKDDYVGYLEGASKSAKLTQKNNGTNSYGTYLGQYYYTGTKGSEDETVLSIVDRFEENVNNQLSYEPATVGAHFEFAYETEGTGTTQTKDYYTVSGKLGTMELESILNNKVDFPSKSLSMIDIEGSPAREDVDATRTLKLVTTLANAGEQGITIPAYLTEITEYSNAAGRRDKNSVPGNLSYVHSDDNDITLDSYVKLDNNGNVQDVVADIETVPEAERVDYIKINDSDEFWGESIIISKPTGQDKNTAMIITIIATSATVVIGVGIILIKKYALKK